MSELSLTVLGASPAWANPGGCCSGYLVSSADTHVLVECGFGVLSRLRQRLPLDRLSAVVISHLHADHFMDLVPLRYGLKYGQLRQDPRLPLYTPPGATEYFRSLGKALDGDAGFFSETYQMFEYDTRTAWRIGSLVFKFSKVKHYIPAYAMSIEAGRRLAFSADAAPCDALVTVATGADLFLCEAAIAALQEDDPNPDHRGHMTAAEAADIARRAGAGRLVLTHFRSAAEGNGHSMLEAQTIFGGPAELAEEGRVYTV